MTIQRRQQVVLLAVAALLFCGWISWLGYLAWETRSRGGILSRPQFLVSEVDVIATLTGQEHPATTVTIDRVAWPPEPELQAGSRIEIWNLPRVGLADGWSGPGSYVLPLVKEAKGIYRVAPIPPSPGFSGTDQPRIYRATPQMLEQLRELRRE